MDKSRLWLPGLFELAALLAEGAVQIGDWHDRPLAIGILVFCVVIVAWGLVRAFDENDPFWVHRPRMHDFGVWLHKRNWFVFVIGTAISLCVWAACFVAQITANAANPVTGEIYIGCNLTSPKIPIGDEGYVNVVDILQGMRAETTQVTGNGAFPFVTFGAPSLYRCHVVNDYPNTILNAVIDVHYLVQKGLLDSTQSLQRGVTLDSYTQPLTVARVDAGKQNASVFYIANQTGNFVSIKFSNRAKFTIMPDMKNLTGPVRFVSLTSVVLPPDKRLIK